MDAIEWGQFAATAGAGIDMAGIREALKCFGIDVDALALQKNSLVGLKSESRQCGEDVGS